MARTSWSFADAVMWLLFVVVPVLATAACGAMLVVQDHGLRARETASIAACNREVASVAERGGASTELDPVGAAGGGAEAPYGMEGLDAAYRGSDSAREAYATCMDGRAVSSEL